MEINSTQALLSQSMDAMQTANAAKAAAKTTSTTDMDKVDEAAKEFEAVFISEMLKGMFEGIETDSQFGGGQAEDIYRGMQVQEYGKLITEAGGIGLADTVRAEMIKMQEGVMQ